jgi:hypothetical protein
MSGTLTNTGQPVAAGVTVVSPKSSFSSDDVFLMKLSQVVMMGIGFLAIWGGVFSVAFDEDATNDNFLVLFVGGLASFIVAIGLIEFQSKKNGYRLYDIQNYFLGIAFFFSTVGVLWGSRYLMGIATGTLELSWFGNPETYTLEDWSPNANGIYAQTFVCLLLTYGHYRLLKRYSGDTSFGWGVATYAPMAVLLAGVGPWIRWSQNEVSWELGFAIISITLVCLEMSLRSNKALNFVVVAFAGALVPIIYETLNTEAPVDGAGGALSLMVFIIALQGYYASRQDLRKEVMERASLLLIGQVVLAIGLARTATDFNLILGPFRASDFPSLAEYVNIPVALWCAVLLAYFPAVLQQRVPWMPVGLAAALCFLPPASSTIPWVLSMLVLPYMVFISKVAREWVINLTLVVFSVSYLLTDWYGLLEDVSAQNSFGGGWLYVILPMFILALAEGGRRMEKVRTSTSLSMIGTVVLSRAILEPEWYLPWLLIGYMMFLTISMIRTSPQPDISQRKDTTLAIVFTSVIVLLLALLDNLQLPPGEAFDSIQEFGFRPQFLLLSVLLYVVSNMGMRHEFDLGSLSRWLSQGGTNVPEFDEATGTWVLHERTAEDEEMSIIDGAWSPIARLSLLAALTMFTFSISGLSSSVWEERYYLVLLLLIPVSMLVKDVISLEVLSSNTRAAGVALLVFIAAPLSLQIGQQAASGDNVFQAALILDGILVAAPLVVNSVISKRGIDASTVNRTADGVAYLLLLLLALLDASGGLLFLPLVMLVAFRTVRHQFYLTTLLVPIMYLLPSNEWWEFGVIGRILEYAPATLYDYLVATHSGPFFAWIGILVCAHMTMSLYSMYHNEHRGETNLVEIAAVVWLGLGLLSVLPDGYWVPTIVTLAFMPYLWYSNKSEALPYMLGLLFVSLFIGFALSDTFQPLTDGESASWSGLLTGLSGTALGFMHSMGRLFKTPPETEEEKKQQDETSELSMNIGALGYIAGYSVVFGLGPLIGFILLAWAAVRNGRINSLLLLPVLLTFSIVNILIQAEIGEIDQRTTIAGITLAVQGILLTILSTRDDTMYDLESVDWESDEYFFAFMDRIGIAGASYSLVGVFLALNSVDLDSIAYLLMTVYLAVIGVQGFGEENDTRWRRGVGAYGAIFTSFLFANSLENDLFSAVGFVLMGMVALGFGFLFMQRMNEDDAIYTDSEHEAQPQEQPKMANEVEEKVEEKADVEETTSEPAQEEESVDEGDAEDDEFSEIEAILEEESTVEEEKPVSKDHSGLLPTSEGFALRLPKEAVNNILASLESTPHDGYTPVVAFGPTGQIMLTFEPEA